MALMQRGIPLLFSKALSSHSTKTADPFIRQLAVSRRSLHALGMRGGMAGIPQTRCLYQAQWHRKEAGLQGATAVSASNLAEQNASGRGEKVQGAVDPIDLVSLRVGRIAGVVRHPEADMLYVLSVDMGSSSLPGEGQRRTIVSGLVRYYLPEQLLGRHTVVFANLKPRKLRGILSQGMLLAASNSECNGSTAVEILEAPAFSRPGDRVFVLPTSETGERPLVKKQRQVDLFISGLTLAGRVVSYNGRKLMTDAGGAISTSTLQTGVVG
ncbi:hypothetical protein GGI20_004074 [Coemansia sp. BCRC 34301]|nr:hypothetical protein GGI20_004074 [Coemansia sp. BCRC 34301]